MPAVKKGRNISNSRLWPTRLRLSLNPRNADASNCIIITTSAKMPCLVRAQSIGREQTARRLHTTGHSAAENWTAFDKCCLQGCGAGRRLPRIFEALENSSEGRGLVRHLIGRQAYRKDLCFERLA